MTPPKPRRFAAPKRPGMHLLMGMTCTALKRCHHRFVRNVQFHDDAHLVFVEMREDDGDQWYVLLASPVDSPREFLESVTLSPVRGPR